MKRYVVMYGDGKCYESDCKDLKDAENILADAISFMGGDNWCDLHIEEFDEK